MTTASETVTVASTPDPNTPVAVSPILDAFDAIARQGGDPRQMAGKQLQFIMDQIRSNALPFFGELRDFRPILQSAMATVVAQFRDVEEILHREEIFSVNPYLPRMMGVIGPFVLSQDITPIYDHDISVMRLVVKREDLARERIVSRSLPSSPANTGNPEISVRSRAIVSRASLRRFCLQFAPAQTALPNRRLSRGNGLRSRISERKER